MRRIVLFVLLASAATLHAQINDSEVWVGSLDMSGGRFVVSSLMNISMHPGYDNQPAFFPDGKLVFTSQIAVLDETGHSVQAVIHDFAKGTSTPVSGALGFSPTPAADGSLMLLRDGHVVSRDASGKESQLTETKDAGYFVRFDEQTWVLYMNDKQRRIVMYDPKTKALDTMALGSMTAPFRIPGKRAVTFVAVEPFPAPEGVAPPPRKLFLRQLNLDDHQVTMLASISFPTSGSHVWTSRGTLLMASGRTIYEWNPAKPDDWRAAATFDDPELQGLTRLAISPRGDRIALVSTPRDEAIIRDSRAASNAALAAHNAAAFAQVLKDDAIVIAASGKVIQGRAAMQQEIESRWKSQPDLIFVRTPTTIEVNHDTPTTGCSGSLNGAGGGAWPVAFAKAAYSEFVTWQAAISNASTHTRWTGCSSGLPSSDPIRKDCAGTSANFNAMCIPRRRNRALQRPRRRSSTTVRRRW